MQNTGHFVGIIEKNFDNFILIGSDKDIITELSFCELTIIGYTSINKRSDIPFKFLCEAKNLENIPNNTGLIVTVDDINLRKFLLKTKYESLATYISPHSTVSKNCTVGKGSFIQSNCFVSSDCIIGKCVKINVGVQIHHDSIIGDCCVLAPGSIGLGHSNIGEGTYIGAGAIIREKIRVGFNTIIGMGSVVVRDIPDSVMAYGNPARLIRGV